MNPPTNQPLFQRLLRHASGARHTEAAVMLLGRPGQGRLLDQLAGYIIDLPNDQVAFVDWDVLAVSSPRLSSGERRMVDAALSLAIGLPVDLQDITTGIDRPNARVLIDAISHTAGLPPRAPS